VLCHFAGLLAAQLRPLDAAGRIGGEEFMLLLPNTGVAGALRMLARLRQRAARADVPGGGETGYRFSAGVTVAQPEDEADAMVSRADRALYEAKAAGRGCDQVAEA
jgi:diguanylate cyclase (GGDEF)-like protein